jgi:hypothetical protein
MQVTTVWSNRPDQPLTSPFPLTDGVFFTLRKGDLYSPDSWSNPTRCYRTFVRWIPRPFLSFRRGSFGFYIGWKCWGCDTEKQLVQVGINPTEVYAGSVAMQGFTLRFTTALHANPS